MLCVYYLAINPAIVYLSEGLGVQSTISEKVGYLIFNIHWLVPICLLSYIVTLTWYQELSDQIYRQTKGISKEISLPKSISNAIYGTLVWLMAYIQVQLLSVYIPLLVSMAYSISIISDYTVFSTLVQLIILSLQAAGAIMSAFLYGWYGFDPTW